MKPHRPLIPALLALFLFGMQPRGESHTDSLFFLYLIAFAAIYTVVRLSADRICAISWSVIGVAAGILLCLHLYPTDPFVCLILAIFLVIESLALIFYCKKTFF